MRVNVEKVLERDQKLSELDTRAGNNTSGLIPHSYCLALTKIYMG